MFCTPRKIKGKSIESGSVLSNIRFRPNKLRIPQTSNIYIRTSLTWELASNPVFFLRFSFSLFIIFFSLLNGARAYNFIIFQYKILQQVSIFVCFFFSSNFIGNHWSTHVICASNKKAQYKQNKSHHQYNSLAYTISRFVTSFAAFIFTFFFCFFCCSSINEDAKSKEEANKKKHIHSDFYLALKGRQGRSNLKMWNVYVFICVFHRYVDRASLFFEKKIDDINFDVSVSVCVLFFIGKFGMILVCPDFATEKYG